jgi:LmbE family N-acetylglucosaminyl deacetylase
VFAGRRAASLLVGAAVAAALLVLLVADGGRDVSCAGSSLYTAAHPDDPFLFQSPDIDRDVAAGRCVLTVVLTAGDAGLGPSFWRRREAGTRAAYARIAGKPNVWRVRDAGIPHHRTTLWILARNPHVTLIFLQLPDGQSAGNGFGSQRFESMQKLWLGEIPSMTTVDGAGTFTHDELVEALGGLMRGTKADRVGTQDFVGEFGDGDHSDHHAGALFTREAFERDRPAARLVGYVDYGIAGRPPNLSEAEAAQKQAVWFAYAPYDATVCQTVADCQIGDFASWWSRQYTLPGGGS